MMRLNKRNIFQPSSRIKITIAIYIVNCSNHIGTNASIVSAESSPTISQVNIILGVCPFVCDV